MPLYFAYGSNMSIEQMAERCPSARALGCGRLDGWRFHITTRGTTSIIRDRGRAVHGVLWRCSHEHIHALDRYEGIVWHNYFRRLVSIETQTNSVFQALTYVSARVYPGQARPNYMLTAVIPAAQAFVLPSGYVRELQSWLPKRPIGETKIRYRGRAHR